MEVVVIGGRIYTFQDTQDPEVIYIDGNELKSKLYDGITLGRLKKYLKCDSYRDALELLRHMFRYYISINNGVLASAVLKYAYFMDIRVYDEYRIGLKPMMELFDRLKFCHSGSSKYNGHHRYSIDEWTLYFDKSGKKPHSPERMLHEASSISYSMSNSKGRIDTFVEHNININNESGDKDILYFDELKWSIEYSSPYSGIIIHEFMICR